MNPNNESALFDQNATTKPKKSGISKLTQGVAMGVYLIVASGCSIMDDNSSYGSAESSITLGNSTNANNYFAKEQELVKYILNANSMNDEEKEILIGMLPTESNEVKQRWYDMFDAVAKKNETNFRKALKDAVDAINRTITVSFEGNEFEVREMTFESYEDTVNLIISSGRMSISEKQELLNAFSDMNDQEKYKLIKSLHSEKNQNTPLRQIIPDSEVLDTIPDQKNNALSSDIVEITEDMFKD